MHGDNPNDPMLRNAWRSFCARVAEAGEIAFRDGAPSADADRAAGMRLAARNIALALAFEMENADPLRPELMRYFDPTRKQGGDNADAVYLGAPIDGAGRYRLSGQRGSARYLAITVVERGDTPWGGGVASALFGDALRADADGRFDLLLGPEPPGALDPDIGNYLRTTPNSFRVTIRQFFADWERETPMSARIDRLGEPAPAPNPDPVRLARQLRASGDWLVESLGYWADKMDQWRRRPNEFIAWREMERRPIDATPGGEPLICHWRLEPGEALLIRGTPAPCDYWNCEFGSYWFETMDYRYRLSGTNMHHAALERDGSLTMVISRDDPGVPNWLDPCGHAAGYATMRWIGAERTPEFRCEPMPRSRLEERLPPGAARIDPAGRRTQLAGRRTGVLRRFRI